MEENADECHQGLEFHQSLDSSTEAAEDQKFHLINFSFSCSPVYIYMLRRQHNWVVEFVDYEVSATIKKSMRVELQDLNDWEEARAKLEGLFEEYPMYYEMGEELARFAIHSAKAILLSSDHRVLHLHIPFDAVHEHVIEE